MKNKFKGLIFFTKKIKDNDLYIKILSANDEVISGLVYGGNSSKKKLIFQNGYFIEFILNKKSINSPNYFTGDIIAPFLGHIFNDKYKMNALLSILSLINLSIVEGQSIKSFYLNVENLINQIINNNHWLAIYCEWLFKLLELIGYQIDFKKNITKKYFDIFNQEFTDINSNNCVEFPFASLSSTGSINYQKINAIFIIFESIFSKNHLDNINYKMPINFTNFKKIILNRLNS